MLDELRRASTGGCRVVALWSAVVFGFILVCCVSLRVCGMASQCSRGGAVAANADVTVRLAVLAPAMALLNPKLMSLTEYRVTAEGGGKSRGCNRAHQIAPCTKITSSIKPAWRR